MPDTATRLSHVLVADDEPHIGRIIKMKLEQGPFKVSLAYDGEEALELINSDEGVDLALLDLMMPNMSGLEVLRQLRRDSATKTMRVVVLTNMGDAETAEQVYKLKADDYIIKAEMTPKEVSAKVKKLLG